MRFFFCSFSLPPWLASCDSRTSEGSEQKGMYGSEIGEILCTFIDMTFNP
jgi:hypothetical protein